MSDKVALVRLRANNAQYDAAMKASAKATDEVGAAGKRTSKGFDLDKTGRKLTTGLTLPLVGLGAVATKTSMDFDAAFVNMQTLAGVTADEVGGLKDQVKALSVETGRGPQELASALYFLRSSGLGAGDAMDALKVSAQASAAGLGDTAILADAVSSAMNAYAKSGLTAADATDVLVATARAGKAEPEQLAGALGRVLPLASELGVTFKDTGAAIAALSLSGNDASTSSTLLTNILSKLLKPSKQAAASLEEVGLSSDGIRKMIAEKGLLGTLNELKARLGDNGFVKYLEDAQAVQGALALTGQNGERVKGVFDEVNASAGGTAAAFKVWSGSEGAKAQRAMSEMKVALLDLGTKLSPLVTTIAGFAAQVAGAFSSLPEGAQVAIVAFAGIAAAAGPLMRTAHGISKAWSGVGSSFDSLKKAKASIDALAQAKGISTSAAGLQKLTSVLNGVSPAAVGAGLAAVGFGAILYGMADDAARARKRAAELKASIDELRSSAISTGRAVDDVFATDTLPAWFGENAALAKKFKLDASDVQKAVMGTDAEFRKFIDGTVGKVGVDDLPFIDAMGKLRESLAGARVGAEEQTKATKDLGVAQATAAGVTDGATASMDEAASAAEDAAKAYDAAAEAVKGYYDTQTSALNGQIGFESALDAFTDSLKEHGDTWDIDTEAGRANTSAMIAAKDAAVGAALATAKQNDSVSDGVTQLMKYRDRIIEAGRSAGMSEGEIATMIQTMGLTPEQILTTFKPLMDTEAQNQVAGALDALAVQRFAVITAIVTGQSSGKLDNYHYKDRWGGVHEHARWGRIPAHIATSPTIMYGERATGGEAMIPRNGDPIRSKKYLGVAAGWYGMSVVPSGASPMAAGGGGDLARQVAALAAAVAARPAVTGPLVQVNPAQGMSERRIGEVASEQTAKALAGVGGHR